MIDESATASAKRDAEIDTMLLLCERDLWIVLSTDRRDTLNESGSDPADRCYFVMACEESSSGLCASG
jgi:hypothetical protein